MPRSATVVLSTELPAAPEVVWELLQRPSTLQHIAWPLLRFVPTEPLPERWEEGDARVKLYFLGIVPLGSQEIRVTKRREGDRRFIRDHGRGTLARRWDHLIEVAPGAEGQTRYTDRVEVEAGLLTPVVWAFAQLFYRHRQRRWRGLLAGLG